MSLADELMNDLDGLSDDGGPSDSEQPTAGPSSATGGEATASTSKVDAEDDADMKALQEEDEDNLEGGQSAVGYVPAGGTRPAEELDRDEVEHMNLKTIENLESVVKLHKSKRLQEALTKIEFYSHSDKPIDNTIESGPIEENPEYALIVQANNLSVEVDNELLLVHKFIRDHYSVRFPELEQIIADPWDYINAVKSIGNVEDLTKPKTPLGGRHGLGVSMTAAISRGRLLSQEEWNVIEKACGVAVELRDARERIFAYVESRMNILAPNVSNIISTTIAAKLLGVAGGLSAFAKTPSCNLYLFGALKKSMATSYLSAAGQQRHTGFVYQSPIVQSAPPELRKKIQRTVASKLVMAARADLERSFRDGAYGQELHAKLVKHIEKMAEPPPSKITKALPIPQETNRKKRGGRRARSQKEGFAQTELRKLQNRMVFGQAEEETGITGEESIGLGMIGNASGKIRAEAVNKASKAKMSKSNRLRTQLLSKAAQNSSNSALSGTSTSLAFTPVQGIEIATPQLSAAQRVAAANDRWFASGAFTHVKKEQSNIPGQNRTG